MPTVSQLSLASSKSRPANAASTPALQTAAISTARGFRARPFEVTWEMTRACSWKAPVARPIKSLPRESGHFSTAEAFHLIEDVASMREPVLALTGGDPLRRPDLFPILEFAAGEARRLNG